MPNQPHATMARSTAGTLAPKTPNEARAYTGKGMPYFAPAWALSMMGTSTMPLPRSTSRHACHQLRPWPIMPAAMA